ELKLTVVVEKMGRASVQFVQQAFRLVDGREELLATGRIKVGCVDAQRFRPSEIPAEVLAAIRQLDRPYEALPRRAPAWRKTKSRLATSTHADTLPGTRRMAVWPYPAGIDHDRHHDTQYNTRSTTSLTTNIDLASTT